MKKFFLGLVSAGFALGLGQASAATLFFDDFESGLGQWGTNAFGKIDDDPVVAGNHVLNFSDTNSGGDIFTSIAIALTPGQTYTVEFDFYGDSTASVTSGGFAGLANGTPGTHVWYAGTTASALSGGLVPSAILLQDLDAWYHVSYTFTSPITASVGNTIRLMFEDFSGSGGTAEDAYFDNVRLSSVPVPAALPLLAGGLGLMGFLGRKRKRNPSV